MTEIGALLDLLEERQLTATVTAKKDDYSWVYLLTLVYLKQYRKDAIITIPADQAEGMNEFQLAAALYNQLQYVISLLELAHIVDTMSNNARRFLTTLDLPFSFRRDAVPRDLRDTLDKEIVGKFGLIGFTEGLETVYYKTLLYDEAVKLAFRR